MAIGSGDAIPKMGTTDAVDDTSTSSITDGSFSVAGDISTWTNDDDAPFAQMILKWQHPSGTIDGHITIHARPLNIDGTDDPPAPDATDPLGHCGTFVIDSGQSATTDTVYMAMISLMPFTMKTSQEFEFYLYNQTGVTMSANWDLDIIPMTLGDHG